jgi:class 3 adenylate cyclase/DNA-binding CsgD family transcriptional regulator
VGERASALVTLLFTDLVGSTELLTHLGDDAAEEVRREHFALLRQAVGETGGTEVKSLGDGLMVVFQSGVDALRCAVAMQRRIDERNGDRAGPQLAVRVGLHAGEPLREGDDFHGEAVVVASRLCNQADGGQILTSELVAGLVGSRGGFRFRPAGQLRLKGLPRPLAAVTVDWRPAEGPASTDPDPANGAADAGPSAPAGRLDTAVGGPLRSRRPQASRGPGLVGRERELAVLESELERAAAGEFRCLLLVGEGGVGKTRLAAELAARHDGRIIGLAARGYPLGATTAFGVWTEALERHLRGLDPDAVERACAGAADDLAGLLRSLRAVRGTRPVAGDEPPRSRLLEAFTVVVSNLAGEQPVVVVLDDLHLADASSLELLHYLAHGCAGDRVLVVATARPAELAERREATAVASRLEQDDFLRRLAIEPLDATALARLAEDVTGERAAPVLVDWVEQRSRGNPLYAIGLLRALLEEGADLSAPALRRLPEGLAERVTSRLLELDESSQRIVELLAVLGRRVDSRSLVGLSGENADDLTDILDRLVRLRGISEEERGHELTYEISHPLVAEAIYQGISAGRRRRLHRDIGRGLLAAGRLGEAAPHFVASADPGDDEAVGVLREAVRAAEEAGSYREALTILGSLVELLPAGDARWADVVDALSWNAQWVTNHRADVHAVVGIPALRAMDQALAGLGASDRRGAVKLRLATFLAWGTGELDEARRVCVDAERLLAEAGDRRGSLLARHELAWLDYLGGKPGDLEEGARQVAREAEEIGDTMVAARAKSSVAAAVVVQCRDDITDSVLAESAAAARAEGNPHGLYMTLFLSAMSLAMRGRNTEALDAAREGAAVAGVGESRPRVELECLSSTMSGNYRWALGRVRERGVLAEELSRQTALGASVAAVAATEMGELDEARRYVARAKSAYGNRHWGFQSEWALHAEAMLAWRDGRLEDAFPILQGVASRLVAVGAWLPAVPPLVDLAELAGRLGRADSVAADGLATLAGRTGLDCHQALFELASAWSSFGAGDRPTAAAAAERAVELLTPFDWPLHLGRAQVLFGTVTDDRDRAVAALCSAVDIFDVCGAFWRRAEAVEALSRLGSAGKRAAAAASGPGSLTTREREVAGLAAAGLSAKEIGERLFIGERTVESHLARAYAKLGVRSKVELVRRAAELDLGPGA